MPKVTKIERAGKDYPEFGIKKGETHYVWSIKQQVGGVVRRSKTYPRQSQLTLSDYKIQAHQLNEQVEDFESDGTIASVESFLEELISDAEALRDEQQEKLDNMPEGLQQGSTGETIQERIDALESFISELEAVSVPDFEPDEEAEKSDDDDVEVNSEGETEEEVAQNFLEEVKAIVLDVN